jgi:hypothetical protein
MVAELLGDLSSAAAEVESSQGTDELIRGSLKT